MPDNRLTPDPRETRDLVREAWSEGQIVIQGAFLEGPDKGRTFLVTHNRGDIEAPLRRHLKKPREIREVATSVRESVRAVARKGIAYVDAQAQENFNDDIAILLILLLADGPRAIRGAGVDLMILLDAEAGPDLLAAGGLDPELMARLPCAISYARRTVH
jgi:chemotaxis response regulator CheB